MVPSYPDTLELKSEQTSAHSDCITSVAFSPDGSKIVSGSRDKTIKVWDANPRPSNASEWEEVDISEMEMVEDGEVEIEGLGYIASNYWKNTVTGDKETAKPSGGVYPQGILKACMERKSAVEPDPNCRPRTSDILPHHPWQIRSSSRQPRRTPTPTLSEALPSIRWTARRWCPDRNVQTPRG